MQLISIIISRDISQGHLYQLFKVVSFSFNINTKRFQSLTFNDKKNPQPFYMTSLFIWNVQTPHTMRNKQLKYNKRWQRLNKSPLISVKDWYFFLQYISLPSHLTLQLNENEIQIYKKDDSTYFMTGIYLQSKLHCLVSIHFVSWCNHYFYFPDIRVSSTIHSTFSYSNL